LEASTFRNGLPLSRASRRAISVFPTPVGPIIRMFLGVTSCASSGGSRWRRIRLRSAIATARLAAAWPTTWRSSSATISRGVSASRLLSSSLLAGSRIGI
jgi:hypothetical protein